MEFWGIEVKPGEAVKSVPEKNRYLHLSQASLGETKKDKASENVPVFVKFNDQKLVIGTLSGERCPQISYDLVFEKEFELSHSSKSTSVFFTGFQAVASEDIEDPYSSSGDSADEDEDAAIELAPKVNGKLDSKDKEPVKAGKPVSGKLDSKDKEPVKAGKPVSGKVETSSAKPKVKADKTKPEDSDDDDDDDDDDNDDDDDEDSDDDGSASEDEDMLDADDSDEEDEDGSSEDVTPQKPESGKNRTVDSASKTPVPEKKAKLVSPVGNQKKGGDGKKGGHTATPHPAKQVGKTPANKDKSKQQQSPKSGGSSVTCKSCSKSFNSDHALQAHSKAKHETAK